MLPIGIPALMGEPLLEPRTLHLQPRQPHFPPFVPDELRVRRQGAPGEAVGAPGGILVDQATAHVMDVVGIAVVGGAEGDDGLQRRGLQGGELQGVEAAPGDAGHPHRSAAPAPARQPVDDLDPVLLLARQILVQEQPFGFPAAADIDPHAGIALGRDPGMHPDIAIDGPVALAIGDHLQDRRDRPLLGIFGQPDLRRHPHAIGQRDIEVLDQPDAARAPAVHASLPSCR